MLDKKSRIKEALVITVGICSVLFWGAWTFGGAAYLDSAYGGWFGILWAVIFIPVGLFVFAYVYVGTW